MGMTIDDCIKELLINKEDDTYVLGNETIDFAIDTMHKYQQLQTNYENRLKADLVAMLTEIQLEIEEIKPLEPTDDEDWQCGCFHGLELMQDKCLKLIQEKINNLKEND